MRNRPNAARSPARRKSRFAVIFKLATWVEHSPPNWRASEVQFSRHHEMCGEIVLVLASGRKSGIDILVSAQSQSYTVGFELESYKVGFEPRTSMLPVHKSTAVLTYGSVNYRLGEI